MGHFVEEKDTSYALVYALLLGINSAVRILISSYMPSHNRPCKIAASAEDELADVLTPSTVQAERVFHFMQEYAPTDYPSLVSRSHLHL